MILLFLFPYGVILYMLLFLYLFYIF